jgi:hypothetical protein
MRAPDRFVLQGLHELHFGRLKPHRMGRIFA